MMSFYLIYLFALFFALTIFLSTSSVFGYEFDNNRAGYLRGLEGSTRSKVIFSHAYNTSSEFDVRIEELKNKEEDTQKIKSVELQEDQDLDFNLDGLPPTINIPYSEWLILKDLYYSLNGPNWNNKTVKSNWNFTNHNNNNPCRDKWVGILCTCYHYQRQHYYSPIPFYNYFYTSNISSNCNVERIVLKNYIDTTLPYSSNVKYGTVPSSIGNLTYLTVLILKNMNILGTIPVEIGKLTSLIKISLAKNNFHGRIPSSLGLLTNLKVLFLNKNYLQGTIPLSLFSQLTNLVLLSLQKNLLTGIIPSEIGKLTKLNVLELSNNNLNGSIPYQIEQLSELNDLKVFLNKLTGTLPSELGKLTNLIVVEVQFNPFYGSLPSELGNLKNLTRLDIRRNFLTGTLPLSLCELTNLDYMDFAANFFHGTIPNCIGNLVYLREIVLVINLLTGTIPASLGLYDKYRITLGANKLYGTIPESFGNLKSLRYAFFGGIRQVGSPEILQTTAKGNNFFGPIPSQMCSLKFLNRFYMPPSNQTCYPICLYDKLNDDYLEVANHCPSSEDSSLCDLVQSTSIGSIVQNKIVEVSGIVSTSHPLLLGPYPDGMITTVYSIPGAISYDISITGNCQLPLPEKFSICSSRSKNLINDCQDLTCNDISKIVTIHDSSFVLIIYVSESYVLYISDVVQGLSLLYTAKTKYMGWQCVSTPSVYLNNNSSLVSSTVAYAPNYCKWTGVSCIQESVNQIDLSGFGMTGYLPPSIAKLTNLKYLNLKYNSLSGSLQSFLNNMINIVSLDLSYNDFNGIIPDHISDLIHLQSLNLQSNNLVGTIPINITTITSLTSFIVSNNKLEGQITYPLCLMSVNVSLEVFGNKEIGCYQSCGQDYNSLQSQLSICSPTEMPTPLPALTTSTENKNIIIIACSVAGGVLLIFLLLIYFYYRRNHNLKKRVKAEKDRQEKEILSKLPIHSFLLSYYNDMETKMNEFVFNSKGNVTKVDIDVDNNRILRTNVLVEFKSLLDQYTETICLFDHNKRALIDLLLELYGDETKRDKQLLLEQIIMVLRKSLPVKLSEDGTIIDIDPQYHSYGWIKVVSSNLMLTLAVETILEENPLLCKHLAGVTDKEGRTALQVAIPECRKTILQSLYFIKRYEILTTEKPHYQSQTCIIHIAIDHNNNSNHQVALKFMNNRNSFFNEVSIRTEAKFDPKYVIEILDHNDSDVDKEFKKNIIQRGFITHPYLIVMQAADRNLNEIVSNGELIDHQTDLHFICNIVTQLARCLNHLHSRNFVHGDIKPKNVMRIGGSYLLIDFDGGAQVGTEYSCNKISSAYSPPEYITKKRVKDFTDEYKIKEMKSYNDDYGDETTDDDSSNDVFPKAHPSQDSWALGMTIFFLLTNGSFFQHDSAGENLSNISDFKTLYEFSNEFKKNKLHIIRDPRAVNLVSNLLNKDPSKRFTMNQVLNHPFITGKLSSRMIGDQPEFDVFISYRVSSDSNHAIILFKELSAQGLKVWLDIKCLEFGKPWETGFIDGLCKSRVFVPILSRGTFVSNNCNILKLNENSPIDNVLLEYQIAVELQKRNLIELICPVMIGDFDKVKMSYNNYFKSGCHPDLKIVDNVIVKSIESRVMEVLDSESLGMPIFDNITIKGIVNAITINQGCFFEGKKDVTIKESIKKIVDAVKSISTPNIQVVTTTTISTSNIDNNNNNNIMSELINLMNTISVEEQKQILEQTINNFQKTRIS